MGGVLIWLLVFGLVCTLVSGHNIESNRHDTSERLINAVWKHPHDTEAILSNVIPFKLITVHYTHQNITDPGFQLCERHRGSHRNWVVMASCWVQNKAAFPFLKTSVGQLFPSDFPRVFDTLLKLAGARRNQMRQHQTIHSNRGPSIFQRNALGIDRDAALLNSHNSILNEVSTNPRTNSAFLQFGLPFYSQERHNRGNYATKPDNNQGGSGPSAKLCEVERPSLHLASALFFGVGLGSLCIALLMAFCVNYERPFLAAALIGPFLGIATFSPIWWFNYCFLYPHTWGLSPNWLPKKWNPCEQEKHSPHGLNVSQKVLTSFYFPYYTKYMANVLSTDKQAGIIGALCEGSSIRSIERMTGVHRDTIMRLGVRVGHGCMALMDETMRGLSCTRLEMDEIWGFVGKKQKNVGIDDDPSMGDVWTFCAIDADTKLVPAFMVGKRDKETANAFLQDISGRMNNRLQISTDGLAAYVDAISEAFGNDVDFAQIIKTYGHQEVSNNRRYSAPDFVSSEKVVVIGNPDNDLISTSYVERLNATTRLHMRRLTRLTLAFSKKLDNFEAAVGLHFAYYNFVKRHSTVKSTPAMAAGVTTDYWSVADLVRTAA